MNQEPTIPTPTVDQTVYTEDTQSANWKTYRNKVYGYQISYPMRKYSKSLHPDKQLVNQYYGKTF